MPWDTTGSQDVHASPALSHRVAQSLWHLQNKWSTEKRSLQEQQQHGGLHLTSWSQRWTASRMPNADRETAHSHVIRLSANALFFVLFFPHKYPCSVQESEKGALHATGDTGSSNFTLGGHSCILLFACLFSGGFSTALSLSWILTNLAGFYCSLPSCWWNHKVCGIYRQ